MVIVTRDMIACSEEPTSEQWSAGGTKKGGQEQIFSGAQVAGQSVGEAQGTQEEGQAGHTVIWIDTCWFLPPGHRMKIILELASTIVKI